MAAQPTATNAACSMSRIVSRKVIGELRYVRLVELEYCTDDKATRKHAAAERTTPFTGDNIFWTEIVAVLRDETSNTRSLVTVAQYRPPVDAYCIELPAGLVDEGETAEQSALRELKEETGYVGTAVGSSSTLCPQPDVLSACYQVVHVDIDGSLPENKNPQHSQEDVEDILTFLVPLGPSWNEELSKILAEKLPGRKVMFDGRYWMFMNGAAFGSGHAV